MSQHIIPQFLKLLEAEWILSQPGVTNSKRHSILLTASLLDDSSD